MIITVILWKDEEKRKNDHGQGEPIRPVILEKLPKNLFKFNFNHSFSFKSTNNPAVPFSFLCLFAAVWPFLLLKSSLIAFEFFKQNFTLMIAHFIWNCWSIIARLVEEEQFDLFFKTDSFNYPKLSTNLLHRLKRLTNLALQHWNCSV